MSAAPNGQQNGPPGPNQNPNQSQNANQSRAPRRNVTGPTSALTDFLAAHNISAHQIRLDNDRRVAAAATSRANDAEAGPSRAAAADDSGDEDENSDDEEDDDDDDSVVVTNTRGRGRPRGKGKAKATAASSRAQAAKAKAAKAAAKKKMKRKLGRGDSDSEGSEYSDGDISRALRNQRSQPVPGQMDNCEICNKRFTVTPYSGAGPDGGLLCAACTREKAKKEAVPRKKQKRATDGVGRRRVIQKEKMDRTYALGPKNLIRLCVETLAKNLDLADDLGDLPEHQVDRIARLVSKRRLLNPSTLRLFVRPSNAVLFLYDAAYLREDDYLHFLQVCRDLRKLKIRSAILFKDAMMEYLLSRDIKLTDLYLSGASLLSDDAWTRFLLNRGAWLKSLEILYTDKHVGDELVALLPKTAPSLERLSIKHNQRATGKCISEIGKLKDLRHLALNLRSKTVTDDYVPMLAEIGGGLQTLCLTDVPFVDDRLLAALHTHCRDLFKLKITNASLLHDHAIVDLFTGWANHELVQIDFSGVRHLDDMNPRDNEDPKVGLCSSGFVAMMAHSRKKVKQVNVHACRHIEASAFEEAFAPGTVYPELTDLEISFCEEGVTPFVMTAIFKACPRLRHVNAFGCMKVKESMISIPPNVIVVGI